MALDSIVEGRGAHAVIHKISELINVKCQNIQLFFSEKTMRKLSSFMYVVLGMSFSENKYCKRHGVYYRYIGKGKRFEICKHLMLFSRYCFVNSKNSPSTPTVDSITLFRNGTICTDTNK